MKTNPITLLLSLALAGIGLASLGTASVTSKQMISSGYLNLCSLENGQRGKVKGIITNSRTKNNTRFTTLTEGSQGCNVTIKAKVGEPLLLGSVGQKIEAVVKVDSPSFTTLLDPSSVKPNLSVIDTEGNMNKTKSELVKFTDHNRGLVNSLKQIGGVADGLYYSQAIASKIKINKVYRIFWDEESETVIRIERQP
jgi:hypothetical protein